MVVVDLQDYKDNSEYWERLESLRDRLKALEYDVTYTKVRIKAVEDERKELKND